MRLSREEVDHVALLARLQLTDQEREQFTTQLNSILDHFQALYPRQPRGPARGLKSRGLPAPPLRHS